MNYLTTYYKIAFIIFATLLQNTLRNDQHIKKFIAAILLLVFCFSATPKEFLHSWFANHKDFQFAGDYLQHQKDNIPNVTTSFFNCHCDNLVVESPYLNDVEENNLGIYSTHIISLHKPFASYFSIPHSHFYLRGPPQLI